MSAPPSFLRRFAVGGVFWRYYLDWAVRNVPHYLQPILLFVMTVFFFAVAAGPRRALVANLRLVFPRAASLRLHLRAVRVFLNFAWTMTETTHYRLFRDGFAYDFVGEDFLHQLARENGAIVLTAHMGSYDLGAAIFAEKFEREIRIVRAPEADPASAQHLQQSLEEAGAGAVRVDYNADGGMLSLDLLNAVRRGEIISIQGDRVLPGLAQAPVALFGRQIPLPSGPFTLALVAGVPIYPLFFVRRGHRAYRIVTHAPIRVARGGKGRDEDVAAGMKMWRDVLQSMIARHWPQWFALAPISPDDAVR